MTYTDAVYSEFAVKAPGYTVTAHPLAFFPSETICGGSLHLLICLMSLVWFCTVHNERNKKKVGWGKHRDEDLPVKLFNSLVRNMVIGKKIQPSKENMELALIKQLYK